MGRAEHGLLLFGMGEACRDMGDQAVRGDVSCQQGDRREDLGERVVEAIAGTGYGAGDGAERQPGSLVQVLTVPLNLFAALGKSL